MTRYLSFLAPLNLILLAAAFALGLAAQAFGESGGDWLFLTHFVVNALAWSCTLAVHCLIFIYFLGTGRWVKEVGIAYALPDAPLPKLTRELKRRTFPPALAAMLTTIAAVVVGAGMQMRGWHWGVYLAFAVAALAVNVWAHRVELRNVTINAGVIDDVMREVDRIRAEHGLPTNAEALRQEREGAGRTDSVAK
jgi:hypothetical protein